MDRFIVIPIPIGTRVASHLKSNMDRFIDTLSKCSYGVITYLKSNMDRFIGDVLGYIALALPIFKIQYG